MLKNSVVKAGSVDVMKYHNDMNAVRFRKFSQRELNIFFSICSIMSNKKLEKVVLSFEEIKEITASTFSDKEELIKYIKSTNEKFQTLNGAFQRGYEYIQFVLFPTFIINEKEHTLTVCVNKDFAYILNDLTKTFTIFELQEFNSLNSSYSKHLFRLLKQWKTKGEFKIEIEEFKKLLDVPESYEMKKITQKILDSAIKELKYYFSNLTLTKIKKGRTITHLKFTFNPQKKEERMLQNNGVGTILCPSCGQKLEEIYSQDNVGFFGHRDFKQGGCKLTFSSIEEIESTRKKIEEREKIILQKENDLQEKNRIIESFKDYLSEENKLFSLESIRENQILLINNQTLELDIFPLTQKGLTSFLEANIKTVSL